MRTATAGFGGTQCWRAARATRARTAWSCWCRPTRAAPLGRAGGHGATPAGLAARDTLRPEVCFHLYGNDLTLDRNPLEAGLGWAEARHGFIGADALREADTGRKLVAFAFTGPGIPRQGNPVHTEAGDGVVTSGTMSPVPRLGHRHGLRARGSGRAGHADRGRRTRKSRAAEIRKRPLYNGQGEPSG